MVKNYFYCCIWVIFLYNGIVPRLEAFPATNDNAGSTCTISTAFFNDMKNIIQGITTNQDFQNIASVNYGTCADITKNITDELRKLHEESALLRDKTVSWDQMKSLKDAFEDAINTLVRKQDIFKNDEGKNEQLNYGEYSDRVNKLKLEIENLEREMRKVKTKYFNTIFELLVAKTVAEKLDNVTIVYAHKIIESDQVIPFVEFIEKENKYNYTLVYDSLQTLKRLNNTEFNQNIFDKLLDNMEKLPQDEKAKKKNLLVVFLCWVTNLNETIPKFRDNLKRLRAMAESFFADKNSEAVEQEVTHLRDNICKTIKLPVTFITG